MYIVIVKKEAVKFGIAEALMINYLRSQLSSARYHNVDYHNRKYWLHSTYDNIAKDIEVFDSGAVRRLLDKLVKLGIVLKDRFNDDEFDKTNWYTLNKNNFEEPF
jgi:hypothetical protein